MSIETQLQISKGLIDRAIMEFNPYAIVMMFSGGNDSLTAYHVARYLGVNLDGIIHVRTGTGIPQTTEFVRSFCSDVPERYIEADAKNAYEDYVLRKGFFGRGTKAHAYAYHLLKATGFRKAISKNFRQGKRGRNILLINGARQDESDNRMFTMREPIQRESKGNSNYWINIINHWSKNDCRQFLSEYATRLNPVSQLLCRSGECMCGTMQSPEERKEAAYFYPQWGQWLDDLERAVLERGFIWRWGEHVPESWSQIQAGQLQFDFVPMCTDCVKRGVS